MNIKLVYNYKHTSMEEEMKQPRPETGNVYLDATAEIVSAYIINHKMSVSELEGVIERVYHTLGRLDHSAASGAMTDPASIRIEDSVTPDYIICLEDGKKLKMLKRYLKTNFNMTPEEYRKRWGLPANYPMVAPNYARRRSDLAKEIGLGKKSERKKAQTPARQYGKLPGNGRFRIVKSTQGVLAHTA